MNGRLPSADSHLPRSIPPGAKPRCLGHIKLLNTQRKRWQRLFPEYSPNMILLNLQPGDLKFAKLAACSAHESTSVKHGVLMWLWVKNRYPKWNPGKWKHGPTPVVPWWFNFEPCPNNSQNVVSTSWLKLSIPKAPLGDPRCPRWGQVVAQRAARACAVPGLGGKPPEATRSLWRLGSTPLARSPNQETQKKEAKTNPRTHTHPHVSCGVRA